MKTRNFTFRGLLAWMCLMSVLSWTVMKGQQSYTFTNCNATGAVGPTQNQVNLAYASTNLNGNVTVVGSGIQQWVVPSTGSYRIKAYGAQGGDNPALNNMGGKGAEIIGEFNLTQGQVLNIVVAQRGDDNTGGNTANGGGGGGGGSFVYITSPLTLLVAAGGGGASCLQNQGLPHYQGKDGVVTNNGSGSRSNDMFNDSPGGVNGGNATTVCGAGGNGWNTVQSNPVGNPAGNPTYGAAGGFGGGGGGGTQPNTGNYLHTGGGGGGYSGGGAGGTNYYHGGGGGGSFNGGTNQVNNPGIQSGHGKVIIEGLCDLIISASSNPICVGDPVTLGVNGTNVMWNTTATTSSIVVSPQVTTVYSVSAVSTSSSACTASLAITVTVNSLPAVSAAVFPSVTCVGGGATLSASGASTYLWNGISPGQTISIVPQATGDYTVAGTDYNGCTNTTVVNVMVDPTNLSVTPSFTMCQGTSRTISASGGVTANSYTWSTGVTFPAIIVSPNNTSTYFVQGLDVHNCVLTANVTASVVAKPDVAAGPDRDPICRGEMVNLIADGAQSYVWSDGSTTQTINRILLADVTYTFSVTGTDANGCSNTATASVVAQKCLGLESQDLGKLSIVPNPSNGQFRLEVTQENDYSFMVTDVTGKVVLEGAFSGKQHQIDLGNVSSGVYYIKLSAATEYHIEKLIIQ